MFYVIPLCIARLLFFVTRQRLLTDIRDMKSPQVRNWLGQQSITQISGHYMKISNHRMPRPIPINTRELCINNI